MKFKYVVLFLIVILIASWFYWFQIRPSKIRIECTTKTRERAKKENWPIEDYNFSYNMCLNQNGINK